MTRLTLDYNNLFEYNSKSCPNDSILINFTESNTYNICYYDQEGTLLSCSESSCISLQYLRRQDLLIRAHNGRQQSNYLNLSALGNFINLDHTTI